MLYAGEEEVAQPRELPGTRLIVEHRLLLPIQEAPMNMRAIARPRPGSGIGVKLTRCPNR